MYENINGYVFSTLRVYISNTFLYFQLVYIYTVCVAQHVTAWNDKYVKSKYKWNKYNSELKLKWLKNVIIKGKKFYVIF